jgi:hypothetical protein
VPFDRVRRCVELARAVLGPGRVQVRWWDFYNAPTDIRQLSRPIARRRIAQRWRAIATDSPAAPRRCSRRCCPVARRGVRRRELRGGTAR